MKDCFALRFNLHRSGYGFEDNIKIFSELFSCNEAHIKESLKDYEAFLSNCAEEIRQIYKNTGDSELFSGKKILFIGDSITSDRISYFNIIKATVTADCIDGSISGAKSCNLISEINTHMEKWNPDIVSIMIGTNDIPCVDDKLCVPTVSLLEYKKNLNYIVECVKTGGAIPIITTIPPIHEKRYRDAFGKHHISNNSRIAKYNEEIKELAQKHNAYLNCMSDVYKQYEQDNLFEPDGVHLSSLGQKVLAKKLLSVMLGIL